LNFKQSGKGFRQKGTKWKKAFTQKARLWPSLTHQALKSKASDTLYLDAFLVLPTFHDTV